MDTGALFPLFLPLVTVWVALNHSPTLFSVLAHPLEEALHARSCLGLCLIKQVTLCVDDHRRNFEFRSDALQSGVHSLDLVGVCRMGINIV